MCEVCRVASPTGEVTSLREAAEWLVGVGYPIDYQFTPRAPEALWQAIVDVIHEDDDGTMHGNELSREEVAAWLVDP